MKRFRRLRTSQALRNLVRETTLSSFDFVMPYFVIEGKNKKQAISSMPGVSRLSTDNLLKAIEQLIRVGGQTCLLFGIPTHKDEKGTHAYGKDNIVSKAVKAIKKEFPRFLVATDVCLCSYTSHGHCGIIKEKGVDNDATIKILGKIALTHAQAGADIVAPSDMMDHRVRQIRSDLDKKGFIDTIIMSYAVKYQSSFYGPFREAANSSPQFGDRKTYQMDYGNYHEAIKEAKQDIEEGADIVMVKPALAYLDVISQLKNMLHVPVAAYSVSGEYSMIKAASEKGWINEKEIILESMTAMKRAGSDIIITYFAKDVLTWIKNPF